jgi:hypothetical protein
MPYDAFVIKALVDGGEEQEARVREDASLAGVPSAAHVMRRLEKDAGLSLEAGPLKPSEGATFRLSKRLPKPPASKTVAVWFRDQTWDGRGIPNRFEVEPNATLRDLWPRIVERAGEPIEEVEYYAVKIRTSMAFLPGKTDQNYDLVPVQEVAISLAVTESFGATTVRVPKLDEPG